MRKTSAIRRLAFRIGSLTICVIATMLVLLGQAESVAAASATWQPHALPTSPVWPVTNFTVATQIACPSTSVCFVGGEYGEGSLSGGPASMYATANGGRSWVIDSLPAEAFWLSSISCNSTAHCVAAGDTFGGGPLLLTTVDGGAAWTTPSLPAKAQSAYGISDVSCPTSSECFAVSGGPSGGVIIRSTDGGATWHAQTAPARTNFYGAVSCYSSSRCTIVGGNLSETTPPPVLTTTDGGMKWNVQSSSAIVAGDRLLAVSCPSKVECLASGQAHGGGGRMFRTTDGGRSWESERLPSAVSSSAMDIDRVVCVSAATCFALGEYDGFDDTSVHEKVLVTTNAGLTWTSQTFAQSSDGVENTPINAISCSGNSCFGAGEHAGPAYYTYVNS